MSDDAKETVVIGLSLIPAVWVFSFSFYLFPWDLSGPPLPWWTLPHAATTIGLTVAVFCLVKYVIEGIWHK